MGNFLHKLGEGAFRHPWRVIAVWLAALIILGAAAWQFYKPTTSSISIPGTDAQKTLDRFAELFPEGGKGSGRIVFATSNGKTIDDYKTNIQRIAEDVGRVDGVSIVISPFNNPTAVSQDRTIAYAMVQMKGQGGTVGQETTDEVSGIITQARTSELTVEMNGDLVSRVPGEILGIGEILGVVLALVVLLLTLGSLLAAGMPVLVALLTVGISMAGLFGLSQLFSINSTTPALAVMLGLAVGIDYSLFIISKYRGYLLEGYQALAATGKAIATAGNAVIFAAATVVIALAALTLVRIPFMTTMGLAGAATVAIAGLIAVTLIPALLGLAGPRLFGKRTRAAIAQAQVQGPHHSEHVSHETFWYKWGNAITRRPWLALIATIAVIAVLALPVWSLKLGLPTDEFSAPDSSAHRAYELIAKGFGPGTNGSLLLVAEGLPATSDADRATVRAGIMDTYRQTVAAETAKRQAELGRQAASLTTPAQMAAFQQQVATMQAQAAAQQQAALAEIDKQVAQYASVYQLKLVADRIAQLPNVQAALPAQTTDNGTKGIIQVVPKSAPSDQATIDLIAYLRDRDHQTELAQNAAVSFGVTGSTALQSDVNQKLAAALPQYLLVVVGLSFVLLMLAFRSILVPLKATLGFLLSVAAMFGGMVAVFQWGWLGIADAPGPIISFIPIIGIGILFGLAMDYEFFLVSSIHEAHLATKDARKAVNRGFSLGSKVVTAAGVIMVSVFAGFISNHDPSIQAMGFGLALGILVDAFLVRMTIVPAVLALLGNASWWLPRWLSRLLPHISIEGEPNTAPPSKELRKA